MDTNTSPADALWNRVTAVCMILAPIVLLISTVVMFSAGDRPGGTIGVYAAFLFIPAGLGLTALLWARAPRLAVALRVLLIFGSVGSVGWTLSNAIYGAAEDAALGEAALDELDGIFQTGLPLVMNLPGATFPLCMAATGIALWRTRAVPPLAGILLAVAGIAFPIGRVSEIEVLHYVADGLFVVALGWIGGRILNSTSAAPRTAQPVTARAL